MSSTKYGESMAERTHRRMQVIYSHKMHERQVFMDDLKSIREDKEKRLMRIIKNDVGPRWYQALSCDQRDALLKLKQCMYNDLLEGRPLGTMSVLKALGIIPRPNTSDVMECIYLAQEDPQNMLAHLFQSLFDHTIDGRQLSYCLNARLILSSILFLGYDNLIDLLKQRFQPDEPPPKPLPKPKSKPEPPPSSPYLQKFSFKSYSVEKTRKSRKPLPLPNLDALNEEGLLEEFVVPKRPPPPPPPPPPKKVLPRSFCDKLAGVVVLFPPKSDAPAAPVTKATGAKSKRGADLLEIKKAYGMSSTVAKRIVRKKKPVAPSTGLWNSQYAINGVYTIHGKTVFVLGNVTSIPPFGDIIHGGYTCINGDFVRIYQGIKGRTPPPKPPPCDCLKKYQSCVMEHLKKSKCYCGHHFDFKQEGEFPSDELPYFEKPTKHRSYGFNYNTIYDVNEKSLLVDKEFRKIWDTDSVLNDNLDKDKKEKKKKKKNTTDTCLGKNPRPEDYLKCALQPMRSVNIAACLPDVHLVPELKEWMRYRLYGPLNRLQKLNTLYKSSVYWVMLESFQKKEQRRVVKKLDKEFTGFSNWIHKQRLNDNFKSYTQMYKFNLFKKYAYFTNLLWPTFFQAQFPDKRFRQIFFSYQFSRVQDMHLMHPYSKSESLQRAIIRGKNPYRCPPDGVEELDFAQSN